jgi:hypothetical protein
MCFMPPNREAIPRELMFLPPTGDFQARRLGILWSSCRTSRVASLAVNSNARNCLVEALGYYVTVEGNPDWVVVPQAGG